MSGPEAASGNNWDMNTDSDATPSVFAYTVPPGQELHWARINMVLVDGSISPGDFGGINGGLANGCLFGVYNHEGGLAHNLLDEVPIKTNAEFSLLAGVDTPIIELAADDMLPIRFTVERAGDTVIIPARWSIRWTNQDDLSGITSFRMMIQEIIL